MLSGQDRSHETHMRLCQSPAIYCNNRWDSLRLQSYQSIPAGLYCNILKYFAGTYDSESSMRHMRHKQPFGGQPDHRSLVIGDEKLCQNLDSRKATHVIYEIGAATLSISKSNSNFLIIYRATYHDVYFLNRRSNLFFCSSMNFTSTRDHLCSFKLCL